MSEGGTEREDLNECWCCGGLHDSVHLRCPACNKAGCPHFGDGCESDHKPVLADGGKVGNQNEHSSSDTEREETIGVNVVSTVQVPEEHLNEDMSDEEITSQILKHGEFDTNEALAESISSIRKRVPGGERNE